MTLQIPSKCIPYLLNRMSDQQMVSLTAHLTSYLDAHPSSEQIIFPEGYPNFVLKGPSKDLVIHHIAHPPSPDQHIYRLRKAKKINEVIQRNNGSCFFVPRKYLLEHKGNYFVVAKRITGTPLKNINELSSKEKKELFTIILEANYFNLKMKDYIRTSDGRIAIVDTQPFARGVFKLELEWYHGGFLSQPFYKKWLKCSLGCATALRVAKTEPLLLNQIKPILWRRVAAFALYTIFTLAALIWPREKNLLHFTAILLSAALLAYPFMPILEYDITMLIIAYNPSLIGFEER